MRAEVLKVGKTRPKQRSSSKAPAPAVGVGAPAAPAAVASSDTAGPMCIECNPADGDNELKAPADVTTRFFFTSFEMKLKML